MYTPPSYADFYTGVTQKHVILPSNKCSMCVMTLSNHLCKKIWAMQKNKEKNKIKISTCSKA
jgi:hypothetical protein